MIKMFRLVMIAAMCSGLPNAAAQDIDALMATITEETKLNKRLQALDQAVGIASPEQRLAILAEVVRLSKGCDPLSKLDGLPVNERQHLLQGLAILDHFITDCSLRYSDGMETRSAVVEMLLQTTERDSNVISAQTQEEAYNKLMELVQNDEQRLEAALRILEHGELSTVGYLAAAYLRDPDRLGKALLNRLRTIASETLRSGDPNSLALMILGHVGDEHVLGELKEFGPHPSPSMSFHISNTIWQIEIQQKPGELLRFLSDARSGGSPMWVVQRAVELGIPNEKIRAAVLAYYEKRDPERLMFNRLSGLDKVVVELGVLEQGELPKWDR